MTTATVNSNATGVWSTRVGQALEVVGNGSNEHHVYCRRPGERRLFGFPVSWLDGLEAAPDPQTAPEAAPDAPGALTIVCERCGYQMTLEVGAL